MQSYCMHRFKTPRRGAYAGHRYTQVYFVTLCRINPIEWVVVSNALPCSCIPCHHDHRVQTIVKLPLN